jgi:hypothetical protein
MKPVLAFLRLKTHTSLVLFWTLVQVLLHTSLIQLSTSCSLLLLGERVRPVGMIYTFTCTCIRLWWSGRITTKPTLVGHIHPNIIIFSQKLLGCVKINKTLLWWWLCAHLSNLSYLTSPNSKGVWLKIKNRTKTWFHNFNTLTSISSFNYLKQAFLL